MTALGLAVSAFAVAQYSERIEVRLHQLNVIVETRDGKLVTDLTKDDFIVLKDKKPQVITNFSLFVEPAAGNVQTAEKQATKEEETQPRERRRFVFFIDDVDIYPTSRDFLLRRTAELLGAMGNGDEGMVVTPGSKQKIPQYLTGDKEVLMATLARVTREMMFVGDSTPMEDPWEPKLPMAIDVIPREKEQVRRRDDCGQSLEICSKNRLASLRSVVKALGQLPGKKVLVLMTNRMSSVPGLAFTADNKPMGAGASALAMSTRKAVLSDFRTLQPLVDDVARDASAANVTIYGIEPFERGVSTLPGVSSEQALRQESPRINRESENGTLDSLLSMAAQTGGKAFRSANEFPALFDQIARDVSTYYSIAFRDTPGKENDFHNVQVRIKGRSDLVVRTRRVVASNTPEKDSADEVTAALLTNQPPNPLGIDVTISPLVRGAATIDVPLRVTVPFEKLTFSKDGENHRAAFNVRIAAVGDRGEFRAAEEQRQEIVLATTLWEKSKRDLYAYDMHLHLPPGRYRVSVRVADAISNERGFKTLTVTTQ